MFDMVNFIQKYRLKLSFLMAVLILFLADPRDKNFFITGSVVILIGELIRLWASGCLIKAGEVTTTGPYSYTRNPLYLGTFITIFGACIISQNPICFLIFLIMVFGIYYPTILAEERELETKFGEEYLRYKSSVPRFFPSFFNRKYKFISTFNFKTFKKNREYKFLLGWFVVITILYFKMES